MREQGRRLPHPVRQRHADTINAALPNHQLGGEPGWEALAATLDQAERAGHDPAALLKEAVEWRELDTADSVTDVLVWRMRRLGKLPATADAPLRRSASTAKDDKTSTASRTGARTSVAQTDASPSPMTSSDPRSRGARR